MKITKEINSVFHDCDIKEVQLYGGHGYSAISYRIDIIIPNKYNSYLSISDREVTFMNYHGPAHHLNFDNYNIYNINHLLLIRELIEEYIKTIDIIFNIKESSKNIKEAKQIIRDEILNKLIGNE